MSTLQISPDSPSFAPSLVAAGFVYSIPPTDGELLVRFTRRGDTAAFAELVELHAPLVLSVCRQVLRRPADVDDAFQATFMILAKRAGDIRASDSAAGWLYRVAYRTSVALARRNKSRLEEPLNGHDFPSPECDPFDRIHEQHSVAVMIEELRALPARYQEPLVLCYLEGHSRSRAAEMLDATTATIKGRLARGKQLLRHRLARRGVALSIAAGIASTMVESAHAAASSTTLATQTAHAASQFVSSSAAATTSSSAVACSLAHQGVSAMLYASLAKPVLAGIAVLVLGVGTVLATDATPVPPSNSGGGITLQASAASDAGDADETSSVEIEAHRPPAPPVGVTAKVEVASPIPPHAVSIQADATDMTRPTAAPPSPAAPTITVSGMPRGAMMGAPSQPPVSQWNSGPPQFGGFVDTTRAQPGDDDQPGIEEMQLELKYWETRAEALLMKADGIEEQVAMLKELQQSGEVSTGEMIAAKERTGDQLLLRADAYQAKAKVLEMKRKIAAREKQASARPAHDVLIERREVANVRWAEAPAGMGGWNGGPTATINAQPALPPTPTTPPVASTVDIYGPPHPPQPVMSSSVAFGMAAAQPAEVRVFWQSDLDAAIDIAKRDGRKVVAHIVYPDSERSTQFATMIERNEDIKTYLINRAVPLKIDATEQPEFAQRFSVWSLPTVCIFSAEGRLLEKFSAPQEPQNYLSRLEKVESPQMRVHVQGLAAPQVQDPGPVDGQEARDPWNRPLDPPIVDLLEPGDEVTITTFRKGAPYSTQRLFLDGAGEFESQFANKPVSILGPVDEASQKIKDAIRKFNGEHFYKEMDIEVKVVPTGRRMTIEARDRGAQSNATIQPTAPQPAWPTNAAPSSHWPSTLNTVTTQPSPTIDPNEVDKLKQELDALRQQCDQLQRELNARNTSVGELLNSSVDPQERSESEEEEEEVNVDK